MLKQLQLLVKCGTSTFQPSRNAYYRFRGKMPQDAKSLAQLLAEYNYVRPEVAEQIDIGFPPEAKNRKEDLQRTKFITQLKSDEALEKAARNMKLDVSTEEVKSVWLETDGPQHIRMAAEHYGVFQDLFGDAYFVPRVPMDITYPQGSPVHRGNVVKPGEASDSPQVSFKSKPDELWTLILTNPDGHLTQENKEYVHWFIGNIPGGDVSKGEVICDYLQPFPALGVGFQRMIFVLYKQTKRMDYTELKKTVPCLELRERTFETLEFYRKRQDELTPAGLAFFQTDWDESVRTVFHHKLNMEQPIFEYDFEKPYVRPQEWFPQRKSFNMYLDKYRDPKDIAKEFLLKKLANLDPLSKPAKPFPFPNIYRVDRTKTPSWLLTEQRRVKLGLGRINQQKDDFE